MSSESVKQNNRHWELAHKSPETYLLHNMTKYQMKYEEMHIKCKNKNFDCDFFLCML